MVKQIPLRQAPNESYRYSNLGYFLLSMLIEEVSGESLREYAARQIFERDEESVRPVIAGPPPPPTAVWLIVLGNAIRQHADVQHVPR